MSRKFLISCDFGIFMTLFYERLRTLLKDRGLSGKDFAEEMGVTTAKAGRWLTGVTDPSFDELIQICKYFDVTADYMLTGKMGNYNLSENDIKFMALSDKEKDYLIRFKQFCASMPKSLCA